MDLEKSGEIMQIKLLQYPWYPKLDMVTTGGNSVVPENLSVPSVSFVSIHACANQIMVSPRSPNSLLFSTFCKQSSKVPPMVTILL